MQRRSKRLRYAIATAATVAVLVATPFLFKKCMKEDIQKKVEAPQKSLVNKEKKYGKDKRYDEKDVVERFAKLVTGWTSIEDEKPGNAEIINGVLIIDDEEGTVKDIIAEYPYEEMWCPRVPLTDGYPEETENGFEIGLSGDLEKMYDRNIRFVKEFFAQLSEVCGEEINQDNMHEAIWCDFPGREEIDDLGYAGKTEQLLSVIRYMDSLGIRWQENPNNEYDIMGLLNMQYANQNSLSSYVDGMGYDVRCAANILKANWIYEAAIDKLAQSLVDNGGDIGEVLAEIPEHQRKNFIDNIVDNFLFFDGSAEGLENILSSLPNEYLDYFYERMGFYCQDEEYLDKIDSIWSEVGDAAIRNRLRDIIEKNKEKGDEDKNIEEALIQMKIESERIMENEE